MSNDASTNACAGGFWLSFGATLISLTNSITAYSIPGSTTIHPAFYSSYAFFLLCMALLCLIYLVCALRTNVAFVVVFVFLFLTFTLLTASYFYAGHGSAATSHACQVAGGACAFVAGAAGWWIFVALMFEAVDFPVGLPVGDLSTVIKGKTERARRAGGMALVEQM